MPVAAVRVAILGLGEAGGRFADDLLQAGATVTGWDPLPARRDRVGATAASNADAARGADVILSMNLATAARGVAEEVAAVLTTGQVYAEANTASPGLKREVAGIVEATGATFADVAIMAPVPPQGMRTPLWVSGSGAEAFRDRLAPLGLDIEVLEGDAGTAATRKLLRSIAYKGIAAVVGECLEAARRLDLEPYARGQLATLIDADTIDRFEQGSRKHAVRRGHEMEAVCELLDSIGVASHTSRAALASLGELQADAARAADEGPR